MESVRTVSAYIARAAAGLTNDLQQAIEKRHLALQYFFSRRLDFKPGSSIDLRKFNLSFGPWRPFH
jgi:hypothetical protein